MRGAFSVELLLPCFEAERIRTSDRQIRNLKLYPAELQPLVSGAGGIRLSVACILASSLQPAYALAGVSCAGFIRQGSRLGR